MTRKALVREDRPDVAIELDRSLDRRGRAEDEQQTEGCGSRQLKSLADIVAVSSWESNPSDHLQRRCDVYLPFFARAKWKSPTKREWRLLHEPKLGNETLPPA